MDYLDKLLWARGWHLKNSWSHTHYPGYWPSDTASDSAQRVHRACRLSLNQNSNRWLVRSEMLSVDRKEDAHSIYRKKLKSSNVVTQVSYYPYPANPALLFIYLNKIILFAHTPLQSQKYPYTLTLLKCQQYKYVFELILLYIYILDYFSKKLKRQIKPKTLI